MSGGERSKVIKGVELKGSEMEEGDREGRGVGGGEKSCGGQSREGEA